MTAATPWEGDVDPLLPPGDGGSEVDEILPFGTVYQLPERWHQKLTDISYRKESPSSITAFIGCPMRWFLDRYADIPVESAPKPSFPAVMGSFVHRVLEVFYSEPAELRDEELLMRVFRNAWDAIKQGSKSGIILPDLQDEFDTMIENESNPEAAKGAFYKKAREKVDSILDFDGDPSEVQVESTETWTRMEWNGVTINGKVDRIRRSSVGTSVAVDDYKTGRPPSGEHEVSVLSTPFIPMGLYAMMLNKGNKHTDPMSVNRVNLMFLGSNELYTIKITRKKLEIITELLNRVTKQMQHTIETGRIVIAPADTPGTGQCSWCPAKNICPEWTDGTFSAIEEGLGI